MARTKNTPALRAMDSKPCEVCGTVMDRRVNTSRPEFAKKRFCCRRCFGLASRGKSAEERKVAPEEREARRNRERELQRAMERELGRWTGPICPHCTVGKGQVRVVGLAGREEVWCVACSRYAPRRKGMRTVAMSVANGKVGA